MIAFVSVLVLILSVIVAIFALVFIRKREKTIQSAKTNYRTFFIMGVFMVPIGIVWMIVSLLLNYSYIVGFPILSIGVVYLAIGLNNRDAWNKK